MEKLVILFLLLFGTSGLTRAQWETDVRLTNDSAASIATYSRTTGIATSGNSIHVVWCDERDGNPETYYKRSTDGGVSWRSDTRLTFNDSVSGAPAVATYGSMVHVVWGDRRDGNYKIYYKRSIDGGVNWGGDFRLTKDSSNSGHPGLAASGSNVHVVWRDSRDGNTEIYYKHSTDGGYTWGNDTRITNDGAKSYNPSVCVFGSMVHIIWEDQRDGGSEIYYKRSTDGGQSWGAETRLTNNLYISNLPTSAVSGSDLHIVWNDSRNGNYEIYYKRSTDGGLTWGPDNRLTNAVGNSHWASVAASGKGVHIAWQDDRNGNYEIFYMYSKDGGNTWSPDTLLVDNGVTKSEYPSIAVSGSAVHVIYGDYRDGSNGEIYYKRNTTGNLVLGTVDLKGAKTHLTMFPNPASNNISISFPNTELSISHISIFNSLGIEVKRFNEEELVGQKIINFSTGFLPSGIYYCSLNNCFYTISERFLIMR